jgi:protein TonB
MSYVDRRHLPPSLPGLAAVVALHVAVIHALVNGLQGTLVSKPILPITARVIESVLRAPSPPLPLSPPVTVSSPVPVTR